MKITISLAVKTYKADLCIFQFDKDFALNSDLVNQQKHIFLYISIETRTPENSFLNNNDIDTDIREGKHSGLGHSRGGNSGRQQHNLPNAS